MANNTYIALDCGKSMTKVATLINNNGSILLSSEPTKVRKLNPDDNIDSVTAEAYHYHIVTLDGETYIIGDSYSTTENTDSKTSYIHKVMSLYSIAKTVDNNSSVKVIVGCPVTDYFNSERREQFINFILPLGQIHITIDGVAHNFEIKSHDCIYESFGAFCEYIKYFKGKDCGVIDIGGLNTTCTYFRDSVPIPEKSDSDYNGINDVITSIKGDLKRELRARYDFPEIEQMIRTNSGNADAMVIVNRNLDKQFEIVANFFENDLNWDTSHKDINLIFIGGTSDILRERILASYPNSIVGEAPYYTNVIGFMKLLARKDGLSPTNVIKK